MMTFFHAFMAPIDAAVLWSIRGPVRNTVFLISILLTETFGILTAYLLFKSFDENLYLFLRLLALCLFVHTPILLTISAGLLRRRKPRTAWIALCVGITFAAVGFYSHWIEPYWLQISKVEIPSKQISESLRIAVVADLQADHFGAYERRALDQTLATEPDLILLPGDYLQIRDADRRAEVAAKLRDYLLETNFSAPLGAFAVRGDTEHVDWPNIFAGTGVTPLVGTETLELAPLTLTGLSIIASRIYPVDLPQTDRFHIVFGHAPDFALGNLPANLLIAGHTHGGQVRLPFLGPIIKFSHVSRDWAAGVTPLGKERHLVVSRGVGLERGTAPRLRFLCRPEIVVIDLVPAA